MLSARNARVICFLVIAVDIASGHAGRELLDSEIAASRKMKRDNGHLVKVDQGQGPGTVNGDFEESEMEEDLFSWQFAKFEQTVDDNTMIEDCDVSPFRLQCLPNSCATNDQGKCIDCTIRFCALDWEGQENSPEKYPAFMYVTDTEHCSSRHISMDVHDAYDLVKAKDEANAIVSGEGLAESRALPLDLGIFDMGQTTSERITNAFVALDPEYKVFADAQPFNEAIRFCDDPVRKRVSTKDCNHDYAIDLLQKVSYLMCRTCDEFHDSCIVKFWSEASKSINMFSDAFPDTDWTFLYNDGETYMGALIDPKYPERAPCARLKRNPTQEIITLAEETGRKVEELSVEEVCAANAKSILTAPLKLSAETGKGSFICTEDLPEMLEKYLVEVTGKVISEEKKLKIRGVINKDRTGVYDADRFAKKQAGCKGKATTSMKKATTEFLENSINDMKVKKGQFKKKNGNK